VNPCDADAIARVMLRHRATDGDDVSDDLVSRNHGILTRRDASLGDIQVGTADSAHGDANEYIARSDLGNWNVSEIQRCEWSGC
jgi:hypothetical protein